jgi:hypothetical protein
VNCGTRIAASGLFGNQFYPGIVPIMLKSLGPYGLTGPNGLTGLRKFAQAMENALPP